MPEDIHLFKSKQRRAAVEWCDQVIYTELAEAVYLGAQPLFADKASFRAIAQIIDDRLVWLGSNTLKRADFKKDHKGSVALQAPPSSSPGLYR